MVFTARSYKTDKIIKDRSGKPKSKRRR